MSEEKTNVSVNGHDSHSDQPAAFKHADADGHFRRKDSTFRDSISREAGARFPPEKGRYVLYINQGCPWAHRAWILHGLKGLEDIIQVVYSGPLGTEGWAFGGEHPSDPIYGVANTKELYLKAHPAFEGRYTVPILWDTKEETIVNNESSEIIRIFYTEFDDLIPENLRESSKSWGGFLPPSLKSEIEEMNDWVYNTINNGVYKTGFATSQEAYEANLYPIFVSLDRIEAHLNTRKTKYLFGDHITEADIRLYTTVARFDAAYHCIFKCNLKMIRHDYPAIDKWYRRLYWDDGTETNGGVFRKTTKFEAYRIGYSAAVGKQLMSKAIVAPAGPKPDILPLDFEL